jgi:hypothetical protein
MNDTKIPKCRTWKLNKEDVPVPEPDPFEWAQWFEESSERVVGRETIGDSTISTVFLGLDHCYDGGEPVLWETMVFGGKLDQEQDRCSGSRGNAVIMHVWLIRSRAWKLQAKEKQHERDPS